jgi:hypothetical protein
MMIFVTMVQLYKYKRQATRKATVYLDGNGESNEIKGSNLLYACALASECLRVSCAKHQ